MAHMMLPRVGKQGFTDAVPGEWNGTTLRFLNDLTGSMDVSGDNSQNGNVSSIPDVWAKPLLFKMFMFDETSQVQRSTDDTNSKASQFAAALKQRVTGEWRCILTMLALMKVKYLNISVEHVVIDPSAGKMESVLYTMRPEDSIASNTTWTDLYIIKYNDIPFAMTSPATLVSVSADYSRVLAGEIGQDWCKITEDGIVLVDPIPNLSLKDRALLYGWIKELRENLKNEADRNYGKLDGCLREFADDIKRAGMSNDSYKSSESGLEMYSGIFRLIDNTAALEDISVDESVVKIRPSIGKNPDKSWLLVDPESLSRMAARWGLEKTHLTVWSGLSANNITDDMLQDKGHIGTAELDGAIWMRPEDFFTEHVYMLAAPDAFMNVWNPGAQDRGIKENGLTVVPPISSKVLEYFSIAEIKDRFSMEFTDDGELVASFNLPFTYTDRNGEEKERTYKIEKRYSELDEDHFMMQEASPITEIWPNVKIDGWHKYYFCYINYKAQKTDVMENMLLFVPWNSKNGSVDYEGKEIDCLTNKYTVQMDEFPESLLCSVYWKSGGYSPEQVDVGLLLIDSPEEVYNDGESHWTVGVDFGTSNTMLYYREGRKEPKPLVFEPNLYQLMNQNPVLRNTFMVSDFIWPVNKQRNGSFLTIYNVLNVKGDQSERVEPLIDGNVFSLSADRFAELEKHAKNIVPNLKWDTNPRRRHQAEAYLEQICLQIAFEAARSGANRITWNFSYPTAFSSTETSYFRDMTERAVKAATERTIFAKSSTIKGLSKESVATAMYFNKLGNQGANFTDGAICLDIGAGTTDLTVITSGSGTPRIIYHSSIQYAGRTMFSPVFAWLERFLAAEKGGVDLSEIDDPDKRRAMLDAVMRDKSDEYMTKAADQLLGAPSDKALMEGVFQISQLAMTGLFYYVGTVLWVLKEYGLFKEDSVPDIYIGGNGSRVIHWIVGATTRYKGDIHLEVLKRAIMAGADMDEGDGFDITLSAQPKIEVAAGMLYEDSNKNWFNEKKILYDLYGDTDDEITLSSVVAGEKFQVNDEEVDAVSFMNAGDIKDGIRLQDLPEIDNLVEIYNKKKKEKWGRDIDLDSLRKIVKKRAAGYYVNEKSYDVEDIRVEPVFIVAMKTLVEVMLDKLMNSAEG